MPPTKPLDELKAQAVALISEQVSQSSVTKVASDLDVSRQAVYGFIKGEYCPSLAVIQRACEAWNKEFHVRGLAVNQHTLPGKAKPTVLPHQMNLFDALKQGRFKVKTRRSGNSMELVLRFKLSA